MGIYGGNAMKNTNNTTIDVVKNDKIIKMQKRNAKKLAMKNAINDLIANVDKTKLDKNTLAWIDKFTNSKPHNKLVVNVGDDLIELLNKYPNTKNLYGKILKWCESNGCKINGTKIEKI